MKKYIELLQEHAGVVLETFEPYKPQLSNNQHKDLLFIKTVNYMVCAYLSDYPDLEKNEMPIPEEELV